MSRIFFTSDFDKIEDKLTSQDSSWNSEAKKAVWNRKKRWKQWTFLLIKSRIFCITVPNQSDPQRIYGQQQSGCILPLQTLCGSFFHRTSSRQVSHVCRFWAWTFRMETTGSPLFNILTFFNVEEVPRDGGVWIIHLLFGFLLVPEIN